jgi:hypothetical protein
MSLRRHIVPDLPNEPVRPNPIRHSHDPEKRFPQETFHPPRAERLNHLELRIREQRKIQLVLQFEFRLRFHRIGAAAQDCRIFCLELLDGVAKLGRFVDSTGSIRFGIEKQNHVLAAILRERHFFTIVGRHPEARRLVAFFQHLRCFRFRCHQDPTLPRALASKFHSQSADSPARASLSSPALQKT